MYNIAEILVDKGQFNEAETLLNKLLEARRRLYGNDNLETVSAQRKPAITHYQLYRFDEAITMMEEAVSRLQRILSDEHKVTQDTRELFNEMKSK